MRYEHIYCTEIAEVKYPAILVMYGDDKSERIWSEYPSLFHTQEALSYENALEILREFFNRYEGKHIELRVITCFEGELFESCL